MIAILKKELLSQFRSKRSIVLLILIILLSLIAGKYSLSLSISQGNSSSGSSPLFTVIFSIYIILMPLISAIMFGGIVAREVKDQSLRYLIPIISRRKILFSKYLAMNIYFIVLFFISTSFILLLRQSYIFPLKLFAISIFIILYLNAITLCCSINLSSERSVFLSGVVLFIFFPGITLWNLIKPNIINKTLNFVLPSTYLDGKASLLIIIVLTIFIIWLSFYNFSKREI
ncbi:ABC transporter permease subunit [Ligilactobacillus sp. WILCCON 0076]|uniref:ABC transporter permease subunit n=1 Tax=Ligilactobacillus ubinensis TaxID=2876789 RepID=A0A9X2FLE7_9LACO|nr:ABC transporter permease subunit [Ligilactobacillus ubinensis]MCP0887379.1 ABC transporter permease subunit [Ligilactobacillus ubinensis]